jgi:hypothetical protein
MLHRLKPFRIWLRIRKDNQQSDCGVMTPLCNQLFSNIFANNSTHCFSLGNLSRLHMARQSRDSVSLCISSFETFENSHAVCSCRFLFFQIPRRTRVHQEGQQQVSHSSWAHIISHLRTPSPGLNLGLTPRICYIKGAGWTPGLTRGLASWDVGSVSPGYSRHFKPVLGSERFWTERRSWSGSSPILVQHDFLVQICINVWMWIVAKDQGGYSIMESVLSAQWYSSYLSPPWTDSPTSAALEKQRRFCALSQYKRRGWGYRRSILVRVC